jgi:serine/threonine protein kinase
MNMFAASDTNLATLTNTQAKALAGRMVTIGGTAYRFKSYDPSHPGQPTWRSGAEGKAYPLLDDDDGIAAYLKFFKKPTSKRLYRTWWLIEQKMHTWLPHLAAAPLLWTVAGRDSSNRHADICFAAYLARAVRGETWLELKSGIVNGKVKFADDFRWRCVEDLLLSLAVLEHADLIHGDLSPNNVVINLFAGRDEPALYLIDFDAFVAPAAGENGVVTLIEGGTYGTEGYCPPKLAVTADEGAGDVAPFSDRYGRDMLLLEFLLMGHGFPSDTPLAQWNCERLKKNFDAWQARCERPCGRELQHLDPALVFRLEESDRPTSADLARGLGLSLPQRRVLRRVVEFPRPTLALLGGHDGNVERKQSAGSPTARRPGYSRRKSQVLQPFYRPLKATKAKIGDDDLGVFITILIGVLSSFVWMGIFGLWAR